MKRTELQRKAPLRRKLQLERHAKAERKRKWTRKLPKVLTIEEELDELCRQIVLVRDQFKCRKCNRSSHGHVAKLGGVVLQVHHIRTKGAQPSLRWELSNLLLVCKGCHFGTFHHRDSERAAMWYRENLGQAHLDRLQMLARVRKGNKQDKQAIKLYLLQQLDPLKFGKIPHEGK